MKAEQSAIDQAAEVGGTALLGQGPDADLDGIGGRRQGLHRRQEGAAPAGAVARRHLGDDHGGGDDPGPLGRSDQGHDDLLDADGRSVLFDAVLLHIAVAAVNLDRI